MAKHIKAKTIEIVYENNAGDFVEHTVLTRDEAMAILDREDVVVEQIIKDGSVECWFACPVNREEWQPTLH